MEGDGDRDALNDVFFALAAPLRRDVLTRLRAGPATVQQLAEPFAVSLNTVSKHLKVLERAGLIRRDVRGREHHCSLNAEPLARADAFLHSYERFWDERLTAMEGLLEGRRTGS